MLGWAWCHYQPINVLPIVPWWKAGEKGEVEIVFRLMHMMLNLTRFPKPTDAVSEDIISHHHCKGCPCAILQFTLGCHWGVVYDVMDVKGCLSQHGLTPRKERGEDQEFHTDHVQRVIYLLWNLDHEVFELVADNLSILQCTCLLYTSPSPRD